jgi:hypothetical protein
MDQLIAQEMQAIRVRYNAAFNWLHDEMNESAEHAGLKAQEYALQGVNPSNY